MGVSRNITIIVYSNSESSYEVIEKFLVGFWLESSSSIVRTFYEDETDNDILPTEIQFDKLETVFRRRGLKNKINTLSFFVDNLNEGFILSVKSLENNFNEERKYEIRISPGGAHKLAEFDRNTDFSFYLNKILPRLEEIGCNPIQVTCEDYG